MTEALARVEGVYRLMVTIGATWYDFDSAGEDGQRLQMLPVIAVYASMADVPDDATPRLLLQPDGDEGGPVYQVPLATTYEQLGGGQA